MSSNSSPSDLINETKSKYREGGWRREGGGGGVKSGGGRKGCRGEKEDEG